MRNIIASTLNHALLMATSPKLRHLPFLIGGLVIVATLIFVPSARTQSQTVAAGAVVRHAPQINGRVEGAVRQLTGEAVTLNSGAAITGDLLVPGTPQLRLNGQPNFGGTVTGTGNPAPSGYSVTLNGSAQLGRLVTRTDPIALPTVAVPPASSGTRSVVLNSPGQSPGDFATLRDLTLNGNVGMIAVPPGTYRNFIVNGGSGFVLGVAGSTEATVYNLNSLMLNGQSQVQVVGPVVLTVASQVIMNGQVGSTPNPLWLVMRVASGGVTLNSGVTLNGVVIAPSGTIIINGNSALRGTAFCDRLTINSGGSLQGVADTTPPVLAINQPAEGLVTREGQVAVTGTVSDASNTTVSVSGVAVPLTGNSFTTSAPLIDGINTIRVIATDLFGNRSEAIRTVVRDTTPPELIVIQPVDGVITNSAIVSGTATDATPVQVSANGTLLTVDANGTFQGQLTLVEGVNQVRIIATDAAGNQREVIRTLTSDTTPPAISELNPANGSLVDFVPGSLTLRGRVSDATATVVVVEGNQETTDSTGRFTITDIPVVEGENNLNLVAYDAAGNSIHINLLFTGKDMSPPATPVLLPVISPTRLTFQTIEGKAESGSRINITGAAEPVTANAAFGTGYFIANVNLAIGANALVITATDAAGNTSPAANISITSDPNLPLPPVGQPSQINVSTGNSQRGLVSTELPRPLIAIVTDRIGKPAAGVVVRFTATQGGGQFVGGGSAAEATTDVQGYASVRYLSGNTPSIQIIRASYVGNSNTAAMFTAEAFEASAERITTVSGIVTDQNLRALPNVLVRLGGQQTRTADDGRFTIRNVNAGPHQLLELIGRDQVSLPGRWPNISYDIDVLPGVENKLNRPLFLPRVNVGVAMPLDSQSVVTQDTSFELPVVGGEPPAKVTARAGTRVTFPPDVTDKRLSVTRIARDRIPMGLEDGRSTNLYVSVQPSGAIFDPPLEVSFPNLDRQPANSEVLLMSFDHDAGRYVRVGIGRVSADGKRVASEPGSGIRVGAWHALPPEPPQPEVTILGHIQISGNPTFEGKVISDSWAWVEEQQATLLTPRETFDTAERIDYTATIPLLPGAAATSTKMQSITLVSNVKIEEVTFSGSGFRTVSEDNGTAYATPHWKDGNNNGKASDPNIDNRFPACYVRNNLMSVSAKLKLDGTGFKEDKQAIVRGRIVGNPLVEKANAADADFEATAAVAANATTFSITGVVSKGKLPNSIKYFNPLEIEWGVSFDGGTNFMPAGKTDNRVYVTLAASTAGILYETLLDIGCRNANDKTNDADAVAALWGDFQDPRVGVKRKAMDGHNKTDGKEMKYWVNVGDNRLERVRSQCQTLTFMLNPSPTGQDSNLNGIGTCAAWSDLLNQTLKAQGINGSQVCEVKTIYNSPIPFLPGEIKGEIMVKKWFFRFPEPGSPNCPVAGQNFGFVVNSTVIDESGARGQGTSNPPGQFINHFIIKYDGKYYDPSYGMGPFSGATDEEAKNAWENASLDGFFIRCNFSGQTVQLAKKNDANRREVTICGQ